MEFLLEIMTEELPSSHVRSALVQLEEKFLQVFQEARITIHRLQTLGTCRRLVVLAELAAGQPDEEEVVTGPPRHIGLLPDGTFSPAALGFARSQGIAPEKLEVVKTKKGEYLGFKKLRKGISTEKIIAEKLPSVISSLSFPKSMRWAEGSFRFSRPIKNLLCLFNGQVVEVSIESLPSGNRTYGHFIHSPVTLEVNNFAEYEKKLRENFVLIDPEERKRSILNQFKEKLASLNAQVYPDEGLLERMLWNVEYPLVIIGSFPEKFLKLPIEVLSTAMREGQKLFSVVKGRKQLPYFLGIADAPADPKGFIASGHERVLKARLEDARFFWENDLKVPLTERVNGLSQVIFQEKLGTYLDKVERMQKLVVYLADRLEVRNQKKELVEAARLSKADLLTEMVREFPELQGKMGGLYAREQGLSGTISRAIYEHYLPQSLDDPVPDSLGGAVLSLADKMDTVVGVLGVGYTISGSSDPFGLRRNALAICKIILEKKLAISLDRFIKKSISLLEGKLTVPPEDLFKTCLGFFEGRVRYIFEKQGYRYDLVNAALAPGFEFLVQTEARLKALNELKQSKNFEPFILMAKRVKNILKEIPKTRVNTALFKEKEEKELYSILQIIKKNVEDMLSKGDYLGAQKIVFRLQIPLNTFFDKVMVMAEDKKLRNNRLALLAMVQDLIQQLADYSQVVIEGENKSS
ncbi:MAG: glycine--tRNA ligase subunit beta [Candidatus Aminicenantes bacterium]|nr:glycine--tRNA ligase subunit beta [Candidatus Aminicenantes bacterium]